MRRCGWCDTVNPDQQVTNCVNCGGPLPLPPGADPGPPPDPPPRRVPWVYRRRHLLGFGTWFGAIFTTIGAVFVLVFFIVGFVLPPMFLGCCVGLVFPGIGLPIAVLSVRGGMRKLAALERGVPVVGTVVAVDRSSPGQPWQLDYTYTVDGLVLGGFAQTSDPAVTAHEPGQPIHVVYLPDHPEISALWPPISPAA